jgi:hypothetical protein
MSTKLYFPLTASHAAGNPRSVRRDKAFSRGTSIGTKAVIAAIAVIFALLYAKGVTLMIDAADTPSPYTTFLLRAD